MHDVRLIDESEKFTASSAMTADENLDVENSSHCLGPREPLAARLSLLLGTGRVCLLMRAILVRWFRHDSVAIGSSRSE